MAPGLVQLVEPLTPERVQYPGTDKYRPGSLSMSPRHEKFYEFTKRILITITNDESQKPSIKEKKIKQHLAFEKLGQKQNLCHSYDFFKLMFSLKTSKCLHIQERNTYSAKSLCPVPCTTANKSLSFSREEPLKYNSAWSLPDTENE